jgi:hypothetical protein
MQFRTSYQFKLAEFVSKLISAVSNKPHPISAAFSVRQVGDDFTDHAAASGRLHKAFGAHYAPLVKVGHFVNGHGGRRRIGWH